jgi:hypothetical protein
MSVVDIIKNPKDWLVRQFLASALKDVAEGKYGPGPKATYWWLHDHALWVGAAFGLVDFALRQAESIGVCAQCGEIDAMLVKAAFYLAGIGLCLGFHGSDAPVAPAAPAK